MQINEFSTCQLLMVVSRIFAHPFLIGEPIALSFVFTQGCAPHMILQLSTRGFAFVQISTVYEGKLADSSNAIQKQESKSVLLEYLVTEQNPHHDTYSICKQKVLDNSAISHDTMTQQKLNLVLIK